jgi:hypothetical protein
MAGALLGLTGRFLLASGKAIITNPKTSIALGSVAAWFSPEITAKAEQFKEEPLETARNLGSDAVDAGKKYHEKLQRMRKGAESAAEIIEDPAGFVDKQIKRQKEEGSLFQRTFKKAKQITGIESEDGSGPSLGRLGATAAGGIGLWAMLRKWLGGGDGKDSKNEDGGLGIAGTLAILAAVGTAIVMAWNHFNPLSEKFGPEARGQTSEQTAGVKLNNPQSFTSGGAFVIPTPTAPAAGTGVVSPTFTAAGAGIVPGVPKIRPHYETQVDPAYELDRS